MPQFLSSGREVRRVLADVIASRLKTAGQKVTVFASAGFDSACLAVAVRDAGAALRVRSFTLDDRTGSADCRGAERLARFLGAPFEAIRLPTSREQVGQDVLDLLRFGVRGKAAIECSWPFFRSFAGEGGLAIVGSAADGHFGLSKKAMINHRFPKEKFDAFRREYFSDPDRAQARTLSELGARSGCEVVAPFFDPRVLAETIRFGWEELNRPRQKELLRAAFPELAPLKIKRHVNLQLGDSGISDLVSNAILFRAGRHLGEGARASSSTVTAALRHLVRSAL